jgi:hypothetical protein
MSMPMLDALRQAASALLNAAPEPIVRTVLRQLLDEVESAPNALAAVLERTIQAPASPKNGDAAPSWAAEWPKLRMQVRAAMAEREVGFEELGERLGYGTDTVRQAVGTNRPKTQRIAERLAGWVADAAAEAPKKTPVPFRRNGAGASNGVNAAAPT